MNALPASPARSLPRRSPHLLEEQDPLGGKHMILNMGPQHPAMHGTLRNVVELDGEIIVRADSEIGFLHTGFEKLGEHLSYHQYITITDRANYMSAFNNNLGFCAAVEEMLGYEVPERGRILRVIFAELGRMADHVLSVGLMGMDLGAFSFMLWAFEEREKVYDVFENCCGARLTYSYARIGGLSRDVPADFEAMVRRVLDGFPVVIQEMESLLSHNKIWLGRSKGVGVLTRDQALAWGVTGPIARAAGVDRDLRRDRPYSGYEEYDFEIPVRTDGDCYARYKVRLEDMRQSMRLVEQGLAKLRKVGAGPVSSVSYKASLPPKDAVYTDMESLIHHFKNIMEGHGICPAPGEYYSATEAPNGELGFFIVSDGTGKPWKVRWRPPSLYNYQVYATMVQGGLIADAVATLSTMNVIAGELDR